MEKAYDYLFKPTKKRLLSAIREWMLDTGVELNVVEAEQKKLRRMKVEDVRYRWLRLRYGGEKKIDPQGVGSALQQLGDVDPEAAAILQGCSGTITPPV